MIDNLDLMAKNYTVESNGDKLNTDAAFYLFYDDVKGKNILEIGCADGYMTKRLSEICKSVDVVEPAKTHFEQVSLLNLENVSMYNTTIENFNINKKYDIVLMAGLLHQVPEPEIVLSNLKQIINSNTTLIATIPNSNSLHRQLGVHMGLMKNTIDYSDRNKFFHQKTYDLNLFVNLFTSNNFKIIESFGYLMKLFNSEFSKNIKLNREQMIGLIKLGKQHQDLSSQLYIKAKL